MLLLGLLLIGATAAFTGLVISDNVSGGPDYTVSVLGNDIATMNTLAVFLAGLGLALLFCLGLAMMTGGGARMRRRKADLRIARRDARHAAAERDALASRMPDGPEGAGGTTADPDRPVEAGAGETSAGRRSRHRHGRHLFGH